MRCGMLSLCACQYCSINRDKLRWYQCCPEIENASLRQAHLSSECLHRWCGPPATPATPPVVQLGPPARPVTPPVVHRGPPVRLATPSIVYRQGSPPQRPHSWTNLIHRQCLPSLLVRAQGFGGHAGQSCWRCLAIPKGVTRTTLLEQLLGRQSDWRAPALPRHVARTTLLEQLVTAGTSRAALHSHSTTLHCAVMRVT